MLNEDEHDDVALAEFKNLLTKLVERVDQIELQSLLSGKYDASSCYFSLNAGAGGTDTQDWNEMLLRILVDGKKALRQRSLIKQMVMRPE